MSWALRAGRIVLVIAVIFFLAAGIALAKVPPDTGSTSPPDRTRPALRLPTEWITTPANVIKETALLRSRIIRAGEAALVRFGVDVLTRSIQWVAHLGLIQVEDHGGSMAGGR